MKKISVAVQLSKLKRETKWSWERMCREFHVAMGTEGPSHTTLFRYARSKVKSPNKLVARWIEQAIAKVREAA